MTRGKSICSVLKTIRKQVVDAYICHVSVPWQPAEQKGSRYKDREKIPCSIEDKIIQESKKM